MRSFEVVPKLEKLYLESPDILYLFPSFAGDKLTPEYLNIVKHTFSYNDYSIQNWMSMLPSFPGVMSRTHRTFGVFAKLST